MNSRLLSKTVGMTLGLLLLGGPTLAIAEPADEIQAPREEQQFQAPRSEEQVQAPRAEQQFQAPRSEEQVQAPRG